MNEYKHVKKLVLFKNNDVPANSNKPQWSNGNVVLEVDLAKGRCSLGAWQYEDTGNISVDIQRVTQKADEGGFNDDFS